MKTISQAVSIGLGALALGAGVTVQAAAPVITNITMVGAAPRFGVHSDLGITNQIQCCTNLSQTNWVVLTNLLVAQSPYWFVDVAAPPASQRFTGWQRWPLALPRPLAWCSSRPAALRWATAWTQTRGILASYRCTR